jgi:hypothetical protein
MKNMPLAAEGRNNELQFHPVADLFSLMEGAEFDALVANIKAHGLQELIVIHEDMILDGRNRYRACIKAGVEAAYRPFTGDDPAAYVISTNIHRRHLTAKQKRELIAKLIKADPTKSDRQIAGSVKASPTTVGTVRVELEATGDVSKLDTRRDTKGRTQPARKGKRRDGRKPLPDCPICAGEGITPPFDLYGPCGFKENTVPLRAQCPCTQLKRTLDLRARLSRWREHATKPPVAQQECRSSGPTVERTVARDNVGPSSVGEMERIRARNEELERENRRLKHENLALRRKVEELEARLTTGVPPDAALNIPAKLRRVS